MFPRGTTAARKPPRLILCHAYTYAGAEIGILAL